MKKAGIPPVEKFPSSFLFYLGVVLAAFGPGILRGEGYFEADLLAFTIPGADFLRHCLAQGHWPLWCPYLFGGQPFAADPNNMFFYPPAYLYALPNQAWGGGLYDAFHLGVALAGMHFWLREAGLSPAACRVGAVLYGLSGFFWWEIIHPPVEAGFAWLPWWGFALEGFAREGKRRWAFLVGLFFALLFLAGHFQVLLGAFYGGMIYFFYRAASQPLWRKPLKLKEAAGWLAAGAWGALPLLALAIPFLEFSFYSTRLREASDYSAFNAPWFISGHMLSQFLFPWAFDPSRQSDSLLAPLGNSGYLGIWWPLGLALAWGALTRRRAWFWAGVALGALILCWGPQTPLHRWVCAWVPGFSFLRAPYRFAYLYVLAGAFLGALGWINWERQKISRNRAFFRMGLYVLGAGALTFFYSPLPGPSILGLALGAGGLGWMIWKGRKAKAGAWIFLAALALSLIWSGWRTCPSRLGPGSNFDFLKNRPELAELKNQTGLGRIFVGDGIPYPVEGDGKHFEIPLPTNVADSLGMRHVQGYNPLSLSASSELFLLPFQNLARLMAVNVIATGQTQAAPAPEFMGKQTGPIHLEEARTAFPFVYVPGRLEVVEGDRERLMRMARKDFNPGRVSYLSRPPSEGQALISPEPESLRYQLTEDDPDEEAFQVSRREGGWAIFSEVVYPGWKAFVDGSPAELSTANHVFRAVYVPAGKHEVRFRYEPFWWTPLRAGIFLWLFSVAALLGRPFRKWALGL